MRHIKIFIIKLLNVYCAKNYKIHNSFIKCINVSLHFPWNFVLVHMSRPHRSERNATVASFSQFPLTNQILKSQTIASNLIYNNSDTNFKFLIKFEMNLFHQFKHFFQMWDTFHIYNYIFSHLLIWKQFRNYL